MKIRVEVPAKSLRRWWDDFLETECDADHLDTLTISELDHVRSYNERDFEFEIEEVELTDEEKEIIEGEDEDD